MEGNIKTVSLDYVDTRVLFYRISMEKSRFSAHQETIVHSHFYYEIHFACKGEYRYHFADRDILLQRGQMLIIPPDTVHESVDTTEDYLPLVVSVSFTPLTENARFCLFFTSALDEAGLKPIHWMRELKEDAETLLNAVCYDTLLGICRLKNVASDFIYLLLKQLHTEDCSVCDSADRIQTLVLLENLVNHPGATLADIASAINYSPRHTSRLIKETCGATLSEIRRSRQHIPVRKE